MSSHGIARAAVARCTCRSAGDGAMYPPRDEGTKAERTVLTLAKNYFESERAHPSSSRISLDYRSANAVVTRFVCVGGIRKAFQKVTRRVDN